MHAPSFITMPARIAAFVISPPSLFLRPHKRMMHVRTLTIARARALPHSCKRTMHVRMLTIARTRAWRLTVKQTSHTIFYSVCPGLTCHTDWWTCHFLPLDFLWSELWCVWYDMLLMLQILLIFPPCRDIGAANCAGINPNRNVHNLDFPNTQEIPFECVKEEQLPSREIYTHSSGCIFHPLELWNTEAIFSQKWWEKLERAPIKM